MRSILFALVLAGAALPAIAQQKTYAVYMTIPCEAYIEERWDQQGVRYKQIQAWISGYVTSYNGWQADTHDILGHATVGGVESWVENYCREHPLNNLSNAMAELVGGLHATRQRNAMDAAR
jgi:hypothetical protein